MVSEEMVKAGYKVVVVGPDGTTIWERSLSGSSFDDSDAMFYLGEQIIESLPEDAFEPYIEE